VQSTWCVRMLAYVRVPVRTCTYASVHMHRHTYAYVLVLVRVRVRMLAYVCVRTPVYVPLGTYTPVHNVPLVPLVPLGTYAHVLVRVRVRMLAYVCVRTYLYLYLCSLGTLVQVLLIGRKELDSF